MYLFLTFQFKPNGTYKNIYHSTEAEVNLFQSKGVVSHKTLQKLWKGYPADLQEQLKNLLQRFGLALSDPTKPEDLIFPCLVTTESISFPDNNVQTCTCELQGVPPLGFQSQLIVQLMVRQHNPNQKVLLFKGGCMFQFDGFHARISTNGGNVTVQLHVQKKEPHNVADTFKILFAEIKKVAKGYGTELDLITSHCFRHTNNKESTPVTVDLQRTLDFTDFCCTKCQCMLV